MGLWTFWYPLKEYDDDDDDDDDDRRSATQAVIIGRPLFCDRRSACVE